MHVDVLVIGGGIAGLWLLDTLVARGYSAVLVEARALGSGQTIAAQGIIHGGTKYALAGALDGSGAQLRDMPRLWRERLAGIGRPDLSRVQLRAASCHLWCPDGVGARLSLAAARLALEVTPRPVADDERPAVLDRAARVLTLDEPVIDPPSLVARLADAHGDRLCAVERGALALLQRPNGVVARARLGPVVELAPRFVVLTAGAGVAELRSRLGHAPRMQLRPLHMVMARGALPVLNGHAIVDGRAALTVTTTSDGSDRRVWQLGGQLAERGVALDPAALAAAATRTLRRLLPALPLDGVELGTHRVDRAEPACADSRRPLTPHVEREGNVITAWPIKLAQAPALAAAVLAALDPPSGAAPPPPLPLPRPAVAVPPWDAPEVTWSAAA